MVKKIQKNANLIDSVYFKLYLIRYWIPFVFLAFSQNSIEIILYFEQTVFALDYLKFMNEIFTGYLY